MPTNIVFGFEEGDWSTSTNTQYRATKDSIKRFGKKFFHEKVNPDNKTVHWGLGNEGGQYTTSNFQTDPRDSNIDRVIIDTNSIKKTSIIMGYDNVDYSWKKGPDEEEMNRYTHEYTENNKKERAEEAALIGKPNIIWGFDKPLMKSATKTAFVDHKFAGQTKADKERINGFIKNLKTCAVHLGNDKADYTTTNKFPKHGNPSKQDALKESNLTKASQQKGSIVFGYDKVNYQTTTKTHYS